MVKNIPFTIFMLAGLAQTSFAKNPTFFGADSSGRYDANKGNPGGGAGVAVSDQPEGPFKYKGGIIDKYGRNNHHSIVKWCGKWIPWYRGWVPGHHRIVRGEYINLHPDGTMQKVEITQEDVGPLAADRTVQPDLGGYLFAHMTKQDYGRLYYSVSKDGLHWTLLNDGQRIYEDYRGHPDITLGHDGRYYLVGNVRNTGIIIWVSTDLIAWKEHRDVNVDLEKTPGFRPASGYQGAPKMYYDKTSRRYIITWHTPSADKDPNAIEPFWSCMRTLYVTSKDLKTFSDPKRLFSFDMATIDVIIRKEGQTYYAIIKDERYPDDSWPTGKTVRICSGPTVTGPYSKPSEPITPNFREAPNLIPKPDGKGWYLYYEQYPGIQYGCSTAPMLEGPWYDVYILNYKVPENTRHGCMIPITQEQYDAITATFGEEEQPR